MIKYILSKYLDRIGYTIQRKNKQISDIDIWIRAEEGFHEIYSQCKAYTMTSPERMFALYKAIEYIVKANINGDVVECGVWKGGSCMLSALALMKMKAIDRKIYLYDTYEGMSKPTDEDIDICGSLAQTSWKQHQKEQTNDWCYASLGEVQRNMYSTGYPYENIIFIKGKVEETIPRTIPESISLLRLDTDFHSSTHHELDYLFPRLSTNGVLILDDYGHWKGAREAVNDYFEVHNIEILLNRIDYTGRIGIKTN